MRFIKIIIIAALFTAPACKEVDREVFPGRCQELWMLSNYVPNKMTSKFAIRCCELIDGNDDADRVSQEEGLCLIDIVGPPPVKDEETE